MSDRMQKHQFAEDANQFTSLGLSEFRGISLPESILGSFMVGETGKVSFDLLFIQKQIKGDLGLFSLEGMEYRGLESKDFKREAIRRTASNSSFGRLLLRDKETIATQTLEMQSGETFAWIFFPEGIEAAIARNIPPILSLTAGNFADVGDSRTVAMEGVQSSKIDTLTGQLEHPYTDLIFRVEGATGKLEKLDDLITPEQDWRKTSFGRKILTVTSKFVVETQEHNIVEVEEVKTEAIDLFIDTGELETNSDFESQSFNESESHREEENGDREIFSNFPHGNSDKDRSEIESDRNSGSTTEIEKNEVNTNANNKSIEEDIEIKRSHSTLIEQSQKAPKDPFSSGVFTVGESGEVGFDFLFDGGKYKSELAIFSLEGMGEYEFGSTAFILEATRRALSNSKSGYVVIKDREEGAKFEGKLGERSWNKGEYQGVKTFQMEAGDRFGVMLIPNGTVEKVHKNPKIKEAKGPLFSVAPEGNDLGQIADLNGDGHTFAMEDVNPGHSWFDRDYNDIIFQVIGATGTAQSFDNAINPEKDWRQTELGQEILKYIKSSETITEKIKFIVDALYNPSETLSIAGLVADEDGEVNISRIDFWLQEQGGEWRDIRDVTTFSSRGDRAFFEYELADLEPGKYRIKAIPYDPSGLAGEAYENAFTVLSLSAGEELSDRVKGAIERAMNLDTYDPQLLQRTQKWIVSVRSGESAEALAELLGAKNLGATGRIPNTHTWEFAEGGDAKAIAALLAEAIGIEFAYPLVSKAVNFHAPTEEPFVQNGIQWHLRSGEEHWDANVTDVWTEEKITGEGVVLGIVDNGFEVEDSDRDLVVHPELSPNYREDLSYDYDEGDAIPSRTLTETVALSHAEVILPQKTNRHTYTSLLTGKIAEISIELEINHPQHQQLQVQLISPNDSYLNPVNPFNLPLDSEGKFSGAIADFNGEIPKGKWTIAIISPTGQHKKGTLDTLRLEFVTDNNHGTKVAGVATASGNNNLAGSGIAPDAEWVAIRAGADGINGLEVADALSHENQKIDIYNNSWGLGGLFERLPEGEFAVKKGFSEGRDGLGSIYVFSAGNGQKDENGDIYGNVNYNAFANSRHTIAVAAIDREGKQAVYSEPGASVLVSAYSNKGTKDRSDRPIATTGQYSNDGDRQNDYTIFEYQDGDIQKDNLNDFGGTSASAPFVSGVIALMLAANPDLTARDVQHILIQSAQPEDGKKKFLNDRYDTDWVKNGAGYWVNHKYGFGAVDAEAAVKLAQEWTPLNKEKRVRGRGIFADRIPNYSLNKPDPITSTIAITKEMRVEWVEIEFNGNHRYLGDLEIVLISPNGTESVLAELHNDGKYVETHWYDYHWFFTSARHFGESAEGDWTLRVTDWNDREPDHGNPNLLDRQNYWTDWKLNLYGTGFNTAPEATNLDQSHNYTEDVPLRLTPIFVTDADGDDITAVLQLSDLGAGVLQSGNVVSNNGILRVNGSLDQINAILAQVEFVPTAHFNGNLVIETGVTDENIVSPLKGAIALTGTPVNDAPMLEEVALSGAIAGQPLTISYADILAASNATDVEGDAIAFIIEALNSGTLTKDGNAIAVGTQISTEDVLEWTPESAGDDISAFSIKATDGMDASENAIDVTVDVANSYTPVKIGDEFAINTHTEKGQWGASVTALDDGGFVVVWTSWEQDGVQGGIYGQRHDRNGNKIGGEFQINTTTFQMQTGANVTTLNDGTFVVTWHSFEQDRSDEAIIGRRYDALGNALTDEFQINTRTEFDQEWPNIASLADGGFVVVWTSDEDDANGYAVYGQRYDSNGVQVGNEFRANTYNWSLD